MPASNEPEAAGIKVEIYKLVNHLKNRMGVRYKDQETGFLSPESIAEADRLIGDLCTQCPAVIGKNLETLSVLWLQMREIKESPEREEIAQQIFTLAHEIKDMGTLCGYDVISHFAESLRDYIGRTDLNLKAQVVIIQAHMDAMQIINRQGVKKEAGPEAEELKKMVRMAIDKYS